MLENPARNTAERIGLQWNRVALVDHDPEWNAMFQAERNKIAEMFGSEPIDLEHIGSTSVPGLKAKPLIDILAGLPDFEGRSKYVDVFDALGYPFKPTTDIYTNQPLEKRPGHQCLFKHDEETGAVVFHLHLVQKGGGKWREQIAFRDILRTDEDARNVYEELKIKLALAHPEDRGLYHDGKAAFIDGLLDHYGVLYASEHAQYEVASSVA